MATALKLDQTEFTRRVVAALPRIVRRELDRATAERIARALQAMHVDARVLPDDPQLVYIDRAGATRGPLPYSSLGDFIRPGESYRLRGSTTWLSWPAELEPESAPESAPTFMPAAGAEEPEDEAAEPVLADEPDDVSLVTAPSDLADEIGTATSNELPGATVATAEDAPPHAFPPPLPGAAASSPPSPTAAFQDASSSATPDPEATTRAADDALIDPPDQSPAVNDPDLAVADGAEPADTMPPRRSGVGRLIVLLVLAGAVYWAYSHWTAGRSTGVPASASTPTKTVTVFVRKPIAPAPSTSAHAVVSVPAASPAVASSAPAPAGSVAIPAAAAPANTPATAAPAAVPPATSLSASPAASASVAPASASSVPATPTAASPVRTPTAEPH